MADVRASEARLKVETQQVQEAKMLKETRLKYPHTVKNADKKNVFGHHFDHSEVFTDVEPEEDLVTVCGYFNLTLVSV